MQTKGQSQARHEPTFSKGTGCSEFYKRRDKLHKEHARATKVLSNLRNHSLRRRNKLIRIHLIGHVILAISMISYLVVLATLAYQSGFYFAALIVSFAIALYVVAHAYMYRKISKL